MKKVLFSLVILFGMNSMFAGTANLFTYNAGKVTKALVNAEALDRYVSKAVVSLDQMNPYANPVMATFRAESSNMMDDEPALGIPSFIWGFVLGWVGILIVYLVTEDNEETKKALWGCVASTLLWVGCYFLFFAAAATTYY